MLDRLPRVIVTIALTAVFAVASWAQEAPQKNWKDRAEYDIFEASTKATTPAERLKLLDSWKQKYPNTDFRFERQQLYLTTYQQLNNPAKMIEVSEEMLAENPKAIQALYWLTVLTINPNATSASELARGERAAKGLLENLDTLKPANTSAEAWEKEKKGVAGIAYKALGWIEMTRKDNEGAEKQLLKALEINPSDAQVSLWLGNVILAQKKPEKQAKALYHFARAAHFEGQGALDANTKKQMAAYLEKVYAQYHGDSSGLDGVIRLAKTNPFPPADFKIENAFEVAERKERELRESNPMLALWMGVKKELSGPNGESYFASTVKGAGLPGGVHNVTQFRGKVISQSPANRPKEVVVGISDATTPEITLKFENPLPTAAEPGTEIAFEGVATAFNADPFMLTMEVEREKLEGWPAPAPAKKTGGKKK